MNTFQDKIEERLGLRYYQMPSLSASLQQSAKSGDITGHTTTGDFAVGQTASTGGSGVTSNTLLYVLAAVVILTIAYLALHRK